MGSNPQRIAYLTSLLNRLRLYIPYLGHRTSDQVFEIYCYFRILKQFEDRGKQVHFKNLRNHVFKVHSKPGNPLSSSFISLHESSGNTLNLFLNGKFIGRSNVYHSPDIVLTTSSNDRIVSIYECKKHAGHLRIGVYRNFIGYCEEMNLLIRGGQKQTLRIYRDSYSELRPCVFTSARARKKHRNIADRYDFAVIDGL